MPSITVHEYKLTRDHAEAFLSLAGDLFEYGWDQTFSSLVPEVEAAFDGTASPCDSGLAHTYGGAAIDTASVRQLGVSQPCVRCGKFPIRNPIIHRPFVEGFIAGPFGHRGPRHLKHDSKPKKIEPSKTDLKVARLEAMQSELAKLLAEGLIDGLTYKKHMDSLDERIRKAVVRARMFLINSRADEQQASTQTFEAKVPPVRDRQGVRIGSQRSEQQGAHFTYSGTKPKGE